jgi:hypothetical protein
MSLETILSQFSSNNVNEIYIKFLSANDNSKNQIYLAEEFVQILPAKNTVLKVQYSKKKKAQEYIFHNQLSFFWLMDKGPVSAPKTKIIFYPQYPEVRFSGFLAGSKDAPSDLVGKRTSVERVLFLGSDPDGKSFGAVKKLTAPLKKEILSACTIWRTPKNGTDAKFFYKELFNNDPVATISNAIRKIHKRGWLESCRLKDGVMIPYKARNGGGYTLEAHLGISPNGRSEPDFQGWEVKQHAHNKSVITLMTPDPDKGFAFLKGTKEFVLKYGYPDKKGNPNRKNFGGVYKNGAVPHKKTGLKLIVNGYSNGVITDAKGSICLIDKRNEKVAEWSFEKIMVHWTRKHFKAVFVPSEKKEVSGNVFYRYLRNISIGQNSKFIHFLNLIEKGLIYLDPALKYELTGSREETKTRYQFRIKKKDLPKLYHLFQELDL